MPPRRRTHDFLRLRNGIWQVSKTVRAGEKQRFVAATTGTSDLELAEQIGREIIRHEIEKLALGYTDRLWGEAANIWLDRVKHHDKDTRARLERLWPYIGQARLRDVHRYSGGVEAFIAKRVAEGVKNNTINRDLEAVKAVLNFATTLREGPTPWLAQVPPFKLMPREDRAAPERSELAGYPLTQGQFRELFKHLTHPDYRDLCLVALHTAVRESWVCGLKWEWERQIPQHDLFCFHLPGGKSNKPVLVVCNSIVREIIDRRRRARAELDEDKRSAYVFPNPRTGEPYSSINNTTFQTARRKAGLENVFGPKVGKQGRHFRVHDFRVTFSAWAREAGVSKEDRKAILAHANDDITTHYSVPEVVYLTNEAEKLAGLVERPQFFLVKGA